MSSSMFSFEYVPAVLYSSCSRRCYHIFLMFTPLLSYIPRVRVPAIPCCSLCCPMTIEPSSLLSYITRLHDSVCWLLTLTNHHHQRWPSEELERQHRHRQRRRRTPATHAVTDARVFLVRGQAFLLTLSVYLLPTHQAPAPSQQEAPSLHPPVRRPDPRPIHRPSVRA